MLPARLVRARSDREACANVGRDDSCIPSTVFRFGSREMSPHPGMCRSAMAWTDPSDDIGRSVLTAPTRVERRGSLHVSL